MIDKEMLHWRVTKIDATPGVNSKTVHVEWWVDLGDDQRMTVLQDSIGVEPDAENDAIRARLNQRRIDVAKTVDVKLPNPEINQDLVGEEG